jgi:hypothetical protein
MIGRFALPLPCHPDPDPFAPLRTGSARGEGAGAPCGIRRFTVCLFLLTACASPEAVRTRGDGPGADVGNRRKPVEIHAGAKPYYQTPCATDSVECKGPLPVFGATPLPD